MYPVLTFIGVKIHLYALFTWTGALTAFASALPALKKRAGLSVLSSVFLLFSACVSFLVCARLWNVAVNPGNFSGSLKWYTPKLAGLSLYGGLTGAMLVLIAGAKVAGKRALSVLDAMVIPGCVAFCLARAGCFLNGCCGGTVTRGPFGVVFPKESISKAALPSLLSFVGKNPVHPTQLYELAGALLCLTAAVFVSLKIIKKPGARFLLFAALFSAMRLAVLPLRALAYPPLVKNLLYPCLYLLVIIISLVGVFLIARKNKKCVIYVHGKGGSSEEAFHYKPLFPQHEIFGIDYKSQTPWETREEIHAYVKALKSRFDSITLIANSIGAYFSMNAEIDSFISKAYFISPVVDIEKLIYDMMTLSGVSEEDLKKQRVIKTSFGEELSWEYLSYVKSRPLKWSVPTYILYGSRDNLTSFETVSLFAEKHNSSLTVMENGEHWFHTDEQMRFLDAWIKSTF